MTSVNPEPIEAIDTEPELDPVDQEQLEQLEPVVHETRSKIFALLETYPYVSRAMIQVGLSPSLPPKLWDPILQELVNSNQILCQNVSVTLGSGRIMSKSVYHLPKFPFPPITNDALAEAYGPLPV